MNITIKIICNIIMLLLVLLSAGNAYEPEWRIIKNCEAKILNTGDIVLIYSINGKDITSKQQAVTNEFFIIDTSHLYHL